LLSREGEIAIAKRIEAGRETMIAGLCESPLTFQAIIIWRDELNEGQDPAARDHRSRSHLCRPGRPSRRRSWLTRNVEAEKPKVMTRAQRAASRAPRRRRHHQCRRRQRRGLDEEDDDEDDGQNSCRSPPWKPNCARR
jgi:RNA polymerase primary sigma factor